MADKSRANKKGTAAVTFSEAALHTRGASQYVDDVPPPAGMLFAAVFGSPVAHGILRRLQIDGAARMPGVVTVLTAADIPGENQIGSLLQDEELLAEKAVHYIGQPVAVVVAETVEMARQACKRIKVDIDELPAITNPKMAYEKGEIIGAPRIFSMGDVDAAWDGCDFVLEGSCDIGGQEHVYLETQRSRAIPLENNTMRIYASTQSPFAGQKIAANILGLPYHAVEVDVQRLGGGFGGKEDQATAWACIAALSAWHTGRPVEIVLNRAEDLLMTGKRHPYLSDFKIGVDKTGGILAYDVRHYQNAGAAADLSPPVLERTLFHSTNSYNIPNVRIFGVSCRTHLPPNTAFRGFGGPQGMMVIESAIDMVADRLGVSREEIQRRNLLKKGDVFPYGQVVPDDAVAKSWDTMAERFQLTRIRERIEDFNNRHFEIKKGLAVMPVCFGISFTATFMNQASALLHVYTDGSVAVTTGGVEMGQGLKANIAIIAARALGISAERVKLESTNTSRVANMSPSAASATTLLNGNATRIAAEDVRRRLAAHVASELQLDSAEKITIENEVVLHDGKATGWNWEKLVSSAYLTRISLSAHAFYATPGIHFDREKEKGHPFAYHVNGAAISEVTVDCLRGIYQVDAIKIVHDLGRPLNPVVDRGQIEGGLAQGLGWMTMEDLQYNEDGKLLSSALATYKVPDVYFMPDTLEIEFLENDDNSYGPYRSKAVGEPPLMYGIAAYFAIRQAMKAFRPGEQFDYRSPLTPERVLMSLHAGEVEELSPPREMDHHMKAFWEIVFEELLDCRPVFLALVAGSSSHSPGTRGARMLVTVEGAQWGTIGGGIMEHELLQHAREVLAGGEPFAELVTLHHRNSGGGKRSGLICAGKQTNLYYRCDPRRDTESIREVVRVLRQGEWASLLIRPAGMAVAPREALPAGPQISLRGDESGEWVYEEQLWNHKRIAIMGGGHCALALSRQMQLLGYDVFVFDTRPDVPTIKQNHHATSLSIVSDYLNAAAEISYPQATSLVVMTSDMNSDIRALQGALEIPFPFIGVMGSEAKIRAILNALRTAGIDEAALSRLTVPVGLPMRSHTPEEIAVSIAAQFLQLADDRSG